MDYGTVSNKSCGGARVSVGVHNELPHSMKQKLCGGDWGQVQFETRETRLYLGRSNSALTTLFSVFFTPSVCM